MCFEKCRNIILPSRVNTVLLLTLNKCNKFILNGFDKSMLFCIHED